jgi:hypothetical protein
MIERTLVLQKGDRRKAALARLAHKPTAATTIDLNEPRIVLPMSSV